MSDTIYDVVIIGAGAAGLQAAMQLSRAGKSCAILEAKERAGGRIHTVLSHDRKLVELGAEFVHGNLPRTTQLCKEAGIPLLEAGGSAYRKDGDTWTEAEFVEDYQALKAKFSSLTEDLPVSQFLKALYPVAADAAAAASLRSYTEGYNAADPDFASTFALRHDLSDSEEEQYRLNWGYAALVAWMVGELQKAGLSINYAAPVARIHWKPGLVQVITDTGTQWHAQQVIVSVPLGVLQHGALHFAPAVPQHEGAWNALHFGNVLKIALQFDELFWDKTFLRNEKIEAGGFFLSAEQVPTWWTAARTGSPLLTGWLGGPKATALLQENEQVIRTAALDSLSRLFSISIEQLQQHLVASYFTNWAKDPFTRGAYSYKSVGDEAPKQLLRQGVADTVYFCGEAFYEGAAAGTVEAALESGFQTAQLLLGR